MGTGTVITWRGSRTGLVILLLLTAGLTAAPGAAARTRYIESRLSDPSGYVESRFTAPSPADPEWESAWTPRVSEDRVAYRVIDDEDSAWVWQIGQTDAVAWPQFSRCMSFDYACWDPDSVVVYGTYRDVTAEAVWVTNGTLDYKLNQGTGAARYPRIDGRLVVWQEMVGGHWDIMAAELDMDTLAVTRRFTVCAARDDQTRPDVSGSMVVWQDHRDGQWDIYGRNLELGSERCICGDPAGQKDPSVDGIWVAWEDKRDRSRGADIYARTASCVSAASVWQLGPERAVCRAPGDQLEPCVGSGYVVWTDWRNASRRVSDVPPDTDIRGYRIDSRQSFVITPSTAMQTTPDISGLTVVYAEYSDTHMGEPSRGLVKGVGLRD